MTTTSDQALHAEQPTVAVEDAAGGSTTLGELGKAIKQSITAFIAATVFLILALVLVVNRQNALTEIATQSTLAEQFYVGTLSMEQASTEFVLSGEDTYLVEFNKHYETSQALIEQLLLSKTLSESERITLRRLQNSAQIFNRLSLQLAQKLNERGFDAFQKNSLQNTWAIEAIKFNRLTENKDVTPEFELVLANFRQLAKDYILLERDQYVQGVLDAGEELNAAVASEEAFSPAEKQALYELKDKYIEYFLQYVELTNSINQLVGDSTVAAHAAQYMIPKFTQSLAERQAQITEQLFYILAAIAIVLIAIFLFVIYQLRRAQQSANQTLNETIEAQRQAEAENERLNDSVINILEAVNALSQRDLRARAPVTEDVIGTVSDSINALAEETGFVLSGVTGIAGRVAEASDNVRLRSERVLHLAREGEENISQAVETLFSTTQMMNQVSALVDQANDSADEASEATSTALQTVNSTVSGMENIRATIAETEKRIKRLGERSQEISGIVNLINTISERTHVLALNASMQAAVAGEAGRGFAVVAQEVQQLAESSRNATDQIATLVNNIQIETNETINTVNQTITQVVEGSQQSQQAGEQMQRTQRITAELVASVAQIAQAAQRQKEMSAELLQSVQAVGEGAANATKEIAEQNASTEALQNASTELVRSVSVFKLPEPAR